MASSLRVLGMGHVHFIVTIKYILLLVVAHDFAGTKYDIVWYISIVLIYQKAVFKTLSFTVDRVTQVSKISFFSCFYGVKII